MYGNHQIFARPKDMFFSKRDIFKYKEYTQKFRLEIIPDEKLLDLIKRKRLHLRIELIKLFSV